MKASDCLICGGTGQVSENGRPVEDEEEGNPAWCQCPVGQACRRAEARDRIKRHEAAIQKYERQIALGQQLLAQSWEAIGRLRAALGDDEESEDEIPF